jgi:hydroxymethylbilane synthase
VAEVLEPDVMLPQVGQGALAVECRADDAEVAGLLATIEDTAARRAVDAERAFLAGLGGGCDLPAGAYAKDDGSRGLLIEGLIASLDGRVLLRDRATITAAATPAELGSGLAERLLVEAGGAELLAGVIGGPPQ